MTGSCGVRKTTSCGIARAAADHVLEPSAGLKFTLSGVALAIAGVAVAPRIHHVFTSFAVRSYQVGYSRLQRRPKEEPLSQYGKGIVAHSCSSLTKRLSCP